MRINIDEQVNQYRKLLGQYPRSEVFFDSSNQVEELLAVLNPLSDQQAIVHEIFTFTLLSHIINCINRWNERPDVLIRAQALVASVLSPESEPLLRPNLREEYEALHRWLAGEVTEKVLRPSQSDTLNSIRLIDKKIFDRGLVLCSDTDVSGSGRNILLKERNEHPDNVLVVYDTRTNTSLLEAPVRNEGNRILSVKMLTEEALIGNCDFKLPGRSRGFIWRIGQDKPEYLDGKVCCAATDTDLLGGVVFEKNGFKPALWKEGMLQQVTLPPGHDDGEVIAVNNHGHYVLRSSAREDWHITVVRGDSSYQLQGAKYVYGIDDRGRVLYNVDHTIFCLTEEESTSLGIWVTSHLRMNRHGQVVYSSPDGTDPTYFDLSNPSIKIPLTHVAVNEGCLFLTYPQGITDDGFVICSGEQRRATSGNMTQTYSTAYGIEGLGQPDTSWSAPLQFPGET